MRSGALDHLIRLVRPGALERVGRSRVNGADVTIADNVPCQYLPGVGAERFASEQNIATAPGVFIVRREPDLDGLRPGDSALLLEEGAVVARFDIKSVRPDAKEPRHWVEIAGVREAD